MMMMMMMMMMIWMIWCFCEMVDQREFIKPSLKREPYPGNFTITNFRHVQAPFEPAQNLNSKPLEQ